MYTQSNLTHYPHLQLLIGSRWLDAGPGDAREVREVRDPASGQVLGRLPLATDDDIEAAAQAAAQAAVPWKQMTALERGRILNRIAAQIREQATSLATILTLEQGKTLREAEGELIAVADTFEWMAEEGKRAYGRVVPSRLQGAEQWVQFEPVGPVAAFSPWNFPAVLAARKVAAALAAGCTVVLKPAEETPGIMVAIAQLCLKAGLPPGVLNVIYGRPALVSETLIAHPLIRKVSFTGSVQVGRLLAVQAGHCLKSITLELGGHSPVIITEGSNPRAVAKLAAAAKFRNAGQLCHAPTRFFVHESIVQAFTRELAELGRALTLGHGLSPTTQMGPLTHKGRVDAMTAYCDDAVAAGARVVSGGRRGSITDGYFFEPTVIADANDTMQAMREEPFGPLALVAPYVTLTEAIQAANGIDLGLGAYAFTNSMDAARQLQDELDVGSVSLNTFAISAPEVPFSGRKLSGLGSEMGMEGLREYLKPKSLVRCASIP